MIGDESERAVGREGNRAGIIAHRDFGNDLKRLRVNEGDGVRVRVHGGEAPAVGRQDKSGGGNRGTWGLGSRGGETGNQDEGQSRDQGKDRKTAGKRRGHSGEIEKKSGPSSPPFFFF